jgi:hypothetical protein
MVNKLLNWYDLNIYIINIITDDEIKFGMHTIFLFLVIKAFLTWWNIWNTNKRHFQREIIDVDIYVYIKKRYAQVPNIISFLGIMESKNWLNLTNLCWWNCLKWSQEISTKNVIFKCKSYVPHLLFHVENVFCSHQFPLNYISYIFYFRAVCYSILHVLLTLYGLLFKIFDKRDDFNFPIVNFPLICSNIPAATAYGVYISQRKLVMNSIIF